LIAERIALKKQVAYLSDQVFELSAKVKTPFVDADLGDPIPIGSEARKLYVATVAGLHKDILEPKLKFIIANIHKAMEEEGNTDKINNMWVGAIYCARELLRWGDRMVNEQVANQTNSK
jgi:hypothetical protein